ncbi:uncharacterized protein LOC116249610 [Nymphaea colorata]|nr:uncharacterized protein LOC116249610 [Nymphaea colorata]
MDSMTQPASSLRFLNLRKSFKLAIHPLLTACPREDFDSAFSVLDHGERQTLHKLLLQVIASLHESMQEEFESICHETQVHTSFELVEQLVEEQSLDILHDDKTDLVQVREQLMSIKLDEIHCLRTMLAKAGEKNCALRSRLESLKQGSADASIAVTLIEKLKRSNQQYGQIAEQPLPGNHDF